MTSEGYTDYSLAIEQAPQLLAMELSRCLPVLAALALAALACADETLEVGGGVDWHLDEELWYSLRIAGSNAGTMRTTTERAPASAWQANGGGAAAATVGADGTQAADADGTAGQSANVVRTSEEMEMEVDRGTDKVKLWFKTVVVEEEIEWEEPSSAAEAGATPSGRALEVGYVQRMAAQTISMKYVLSTDPVSK